MTTKNKVAPISTDFRTRSGLRVSEGEIAIAQLQVAIDRKLGRESLPILVEIANAKVASHPRSN